MRNADSTIPISLGLDGTSALEAIVDTRGFRYARISCMANTEVSLDATDGANRLLESDDGVTFSEIAASVAGSAFVPASSLPQTNIPRLVYDIDLRGRKRFIKVQYQTAQTTQPFIVTDFEMPISSALTKTEAFAGVFGSDRAKRFISECVAGQQHLDIVVIGDSNVGSSGGYGRAWMSEMISHGAKPYGSGIMACAQGGSLGAADLFHPGMGINALNGRVVGQSAGVSWLTWGSLEGISAIDDIWNKNGGTLRQLGAVGTGDPGIDWIYYGTGTNDSTANLYIEVTTACPTPPSANWISRVGYVTFNTGSGYFVTRWTRDASPYTTIAAQQFSTNTGAIGYAIAETEIGADPSRNFDIKVSRYNAGSSGGALHPNTLSAPAGFMFESVYVRNVFGFACTAMQFYPGATTTQIVNGLTGAGETATTFLKEIRERQIAAGGNGRVVVWLNSGVNGGPAAPSNWSDGADDLRDDLTSRWVALGYPASDLAFLFSVSHQYSADDNMEGTYSEARSWVSGKDDSTVVDLSIMSKFSVLDSLSLLDDPITVHLTQSGYAYVVKRIIASILSSRTTAQVVKI